MKERPILFSAPMVRAILDGRKTQTRRVMKLQPVQSQSDPAVYGWYGEDGFLIPTADADGDEGPVCPYGTGGDRLWVREAWRTLPEADDIAPRNLMNVEAYTHYEADNNHEGMGKLRPGMFMPRWASRIDLDITGVRVERIKDITHADVLAEGIEPSGLDSPVNESIDRLNFSTLWDNINARRGYPWDDDDGPPPGFRPIDAYWPNPWVWVVEFKVLP